MEGGGGRIVLDENEEEITAVHSDDLESRPMLPPHRRDGPAPIEGTVALPSSQILPPRDEHTVLLAAPDELGPDGGEVDGGWATVVLPGGGYPAHVADRTQLLAFDDPSSGAPEAVEPVITENLPGMGSPGLAPPRSITVPALPPSTPGSAVALPVSVALPTGGHPSVTGGYPPATGGYATVGAPTGGYATVDPVASGGHPTARARGRAAPRAAPRFAPPLTGAHPSVGARSDESTRLAWGFLVGVLIAIAVVGTAIGVVLLVLR